MPTPHLRRSLLLLPLAMALLVAACGGSDGPSSALSDDTVQSLEDSADDLVESVQAAQDAAGGGNFTLTIGNDTWEFDSVLCAFGEEEIGQEGAEFVLSSIQNGLQAYVSIDSFGESVSIDDIEDFENPSVSYTSFGDDATITIDGKDVSGLGTFLNNTTDGLEQVPGTFSGTCP